MPNSPLITWRKPVALPQLNIKEEGTGYRVTCDEAPEMDLVKPTYGLAEKEGHDYVMNRRNALRNGQTFEKSVVTEPVAPLSEDLMARAEGMRARMEGDAVPEPEELFDATAPVAPRKAVRK